MRAAFTDCRQVYGNPRLARVLNRRGVNCCENTVAKVLRAEPPHVLDRHFTTGTPNAKRTADITHLWTAGGWVGLW
ncbi:IS3 family transposase [Limnoglobus roseus]|uniref:IS3 family transposase n=1 Tax=Limnoglobus roseus TaxID=2598579 RepID=A0A5C1AQN8_9BACT|nr:IS3 family transposase [Limnoglobus roseus]QEL20935.1 IS3 family transposase [Limnoglobus roseus]